ncbi:type VI secretion system baseplate subunit TssF [Robbsia sp. KACC 23696]|uniref:type VI secretion system baseplate subunit TssF n=1 Tax=Robbsia sp. KACC 23696 TaxID=3149231 RepID=UPI00325B68C8
MSEANSDDLLDYFKSELGYLREQGAAFAQRYPKVANNLGLHGGDALDPHVERLIESTAFLAARVHRDLDQSFPQIPAALLATVCPSLGQPVPSMTVVQLDFDADKGKVTAGYRIPRHTGLVARTAQDETCRFRTAWDTTLWPVHVTQAETVGDLAIQLTLETLGGADFSELDIDRLRFHLHGDWTETMPLYDVLAGGVQHVDVVSAAPSATSATGTTVTLPSDAWRELGFEEDETVLNAPVFGYLPYTMLQEYFAFPRKFHFFDLALPPGALGRGHRATILLRLRSPMRRLPALRASNLMMGCVPAVNLFSRTSEPVVLDRRRYEYPLQADHRRDASTEIHSIEKVVAVDPMTDRTVVIPAVTAGITHDAARGVAKMGAIRWSARRESSLRPGQPGTDMTISFVDSDDSPACPPEQTIYAHVLCTNRRLAEQMRHGTAMGIDGLSAHVRVRCLYAPTPQHDPPLGAATLWRLVSLLTRNYHSLLHSDNGAAWLQELLTLFSPQTARDYKQIRGIQALSARPGTAHVGTDGWRGFCRGTDITLQFDEDAFAGSSPLLLGAVLSRFFAMHTSVNAFVRVNARGREERWRSWPAMAGLQPLL